MEWQHFETLRFACRDSMPELRRRLLLFGALGSIHQLNAGFRDASRWQYIITFGHSSSPIDSEWNDGKRCFACSDSMPELRRRLLSLLSSLSGALDSGGPSIMRSLMELFPELSAHESGPCTFCTVYSSRLPTITSFHAMPPSWSIWKLHKSFPQRL
ncbi:hypothetical protein K435DRAFT_865876 [Dendrothele bispora CBS 962.96]|uniref:Uncharacterized protein n=1 Tax=Dendrothele bispora (strain CBS 962.96) TaxID=1314807 RepID=A0A4S8LI72_DENBC|nr:hypothetical protein K435DRAFT_865876 [Dendrothele bispora CBS 962.96]